MATISVAMFLGTEARALKLLPAGRLASTSLTVLLALMLVVSGPPKPAVAASGPSLSVGRPVWNLGDSWVMELCSGRPISGQPSRFSFRVVGQGDQLGYNGVYLLERTADTGTVNAWVLDLNLNRLAFFDHRTRQILIRYRNYTERAWPLTDRKSWTFEGDSQDLRSGTVDSFQGEARVGVFRFQGRAYFRLVRREGWRVHNRDLAIRRIEIWDASGRQVLYDGAPRIAADGTVTESPNAFCLKDHPISAWVGALLVGAGTEATPAVPPATVQSPPPPPPVPVGQVGLEPFPPAGFTALLGTSRTEVFRRFGQPLRTSVGRKSDYDRIPGVITGPVQECLFWLYPHGQRGLFGDPEESMTIEFCGPQKDAINSVRYQCRPLFATIICPTIETVATRERLEPLKWEGVVFGWSDFAPRPFLGSCEGKRDIHILYRPRQGVLFHVDGLNQTNVPTWRRIFDPTTGQYQEGTCALNRPTAWSRDVIDRWDVLPDPPRP